MSDYFPMPEGYRCPLCPDHDDDKFCWDPLLSSPICQGCSHEIINLVVDVNPIKDSALERLMEVTGLAYEELQVAVLGPHIRYLERVLQPENQSEITWGRVGQEAEEIIEDYQRSLSECRRLLATAKARLRAREKAKTTDKTERGKVVPILDR